MKGASKGGRIFQSVVCGIVVGMLVGAVHWFILEHDLTLITDVLLGDLIGSVATVLVCVALHLRQEELHYVRSVSCAQIVSEVNHRIHSGMFPLCLAAEKYGDTDAPKVVNTAMERVNMALQKASHAAILGPFGETIKTR